MLQQGFTGNHHLTANSGDTSEQPCKRPQYGGFTRAGLAHQAERLSAIDRKRDVTYRMKGLFAMAEHHVEAADIDHSTASGFASQAGSRFKTGSSL